MSFTSRVRHAAGRTYIEVMLGLICELLILSGAVGPCMVVAGYLFWHFGVREPYLFTILTVVIGYVAGWTLNGLFLGLIARKLRAKKVPRKPAS